MNTEVQARFCSFESNGEPKYYYCQRNEYCCNFGCCLSPTFQFYQLWYYWLMVIFMFLLCSGGQWWYRYWLQGRYSGDLGSSMPYRATSNHMTQPRRPPRPVRVSYHPSRDAVVLQHIWKPNYSGSNSVHNSPPPAYSNGIVPSGAPSREGTENEQRLGPGVGVPKPSPYFQLYGPPPSYEQVIREARGQQHQQPQQGQDEGGCCASTPGAMGDVSGCPYRPMAEGVPPPPHSTSLPVPVHHQSDVTINVLASK